MTITFVLDVLITFPLPLPQTLPSQVALVRPTSLNKNYVSIPSPLLFV